MMNHDLPLIQANLIDLAYVSYKDAITTIRENLASEERAGVDNLRSVLNQYFLDNLSDENNDFRNVVLETVNNLHIEEFITEAFPSEEKDRAYIETLYKDLLFDYKGFEPKVIKLVQLDNDKR